MLGPILNPTAYTADAFNTLLEERKKDLYAGARSLATKDQLNKAVELAGYKPVSTPAVTENKFAGFSVVTGATPEAQVKEPKPRNTFKP